MHKITVSECIGQTSAYNHMTRAYDTRITTLALKATIQPPVDLNPEVVSRYVTAGNWKGFSEGVIPIKDALLVGSTPEETVIRAEISPNDNPAKELDLVATRTAKILDFMGLQSEIVIQPNITE